MIPIGLLLTIIYIIIVCVIVMSVRKSIQNNAEKEISVLEQAMQKLKK